jgi:spoIIIJ-associated protein
MSDKQEFYGATVEEAVEKASSALNIAREKLEFEVLDRGSTGFLGIGTRDARIVVERHESEGGGLTEGSYDQPLEPSDQGSFAPAVVPSETTQPVKDPDVPPEEAPYELIVAIDEFMTNLIDAMGFDATVDAYSTGDTITVDVATKETGLFIGQKGETIDSVQYLLNAAVYRNRPFFKRIIVDSEGYRQRRVEAIQGIAHRTARRALREKRPLSLPPMSAAERRIVHLFLKENPNVTTFSDGEEEGRKVIISPA